MVKRSRVKDAFPSKRENCIPKGYIPRMINSMLRVVEKERDGKFRRLD